MPRNSLASCGWHQQLLQNPAALRSSTSMWRVRRAIGAGRVGAARRRPNIDATCRRQAGAPHRRLPSAAALASAPGAIESSSGLRPPPLRRASSAVPSGLRPPAQRTDWRERLGQRQRVLELALEALPAVRLDQAASGSSPGQQHEARALVSAITGSVARSARRAALRPAASPSNAKNDVVVIRSSALTCAPVIAVRAPPRTRRSLAARAGSRPCNPRPMARPACRMALAPLVQTVELLALVEDRRLRRVSGISAPRAPMIARRNRMT